MEKNFSIMIIHEKSGEIRQIKAGKSVTNALRQAKDIALRLELNRGSPCVFELSAGDKTVTLDNLKDVRAWVAENTEFGAVTF